MVDDSLLNVYLILNIQAQVKEQTNGDFVAAGWEGRRAGSEA